jgi:hypothetical protein
MNLDNRKPSRTDPGPGPRSKPKGLTFTIDRDHPQGRGDYTSVEVTIQFDGWEARGMVFANCVKTVEAELRRYTRT